MAVPAGATARVSARQDRHHRLDEDDVRVRPGRSKSRPRSKDRPSHDDARSATVLAVDRGRFTLDLDEGQRGYAVKARELGRKGIVVGDDVDILGESASLDSPARIVRRRPRSSTLRRTADDVDPVERVIVANATQLAIVTSTIDPDPRAGLIDRAIVAALDAQIDPLLVITKADLRPATELTALYEPLAIETFVIDDRQVPAGLVRTLTGQTTVLLGHSGVGKSTLVNAVVPVAERATGAVNTVTGRGRHTSTSVVAFHLPGGGLVIDTPGIRSFGLAHVDPSRIVAAFDDLADTIASCPRACSHDEPDCALTAELDHADADRRARILSLRRLLGSRNPDPTWPGPAA